MTHQDDTAKGAVRWQVESLRATTFHVRGAYDPESTNWWEAVIGDKPEQVVTRPREGLVQHSGAFEGRQLMLIGRPDRVDWILHGIVSFPGEAMQGLPILGPLSDSLESFRKVTEKWLIVSPEVTRLAFGAVLVRSAADLALAYQELSRFLPSVNLDDIDTPDFLYQINRRRTSKAPIETRINRISKWSVMQGGTISIGIGPDTGPMLASGSPHLACRLELDINTSAESANPIPRDQTQELFMELVELGSEIAEKGDIP